MNYSQIIIQDFQQDFSRNSTRNIFAGNQTARCKGCFGCWLKTPGECVMKDGSEMVGSYIAQTNRVIIASEILYGGFSIPVKRMLDRSIPCVLPFFKWRNKRMHHMPRYKNQPSFHIYFYNSHTASEQEKILAEKVAKAMAINFNCSTCQVTFLDNQPILEDICQ